jgi:hypothetical protein
VATLIEGPRTRDDGETGSPDAGEQGSQVVPPEPASSSAHASSSSESEPASPAGPPDRTLLYLFSTLALLSVIIGVFGYRRYANSERWVAEGIKKMDAIGAELDSESCVDEAVDWYNACDEHDANAAVCLQGVGILMQHCLSARERDQTCELYLDPESAVHEASEGMRERARNPEAAGESGRWVYARCEERGMVCRDKRECACASAYRAIDSFCRTGQQAVQL